MVVVGRKGGCKIYAVIYLRGADISVLSFKKVEVNVFNSPFD